MDIAIELFKKEFTKRVECDPQHKKGHHHKGPNGHNMKKIEEKIQKETKEAKIEAPSLDRSIEAFFIGPRSENILFFKYLIEKAINSHSAARIEYEIEDARHITRKMKI